ncbi:golgin subfamily A member 6-like protein 22 [Hippoglossus stenolepis]|uniref:golgin subfamily A member 6-like protein 22 n=1 Tax=Hippoglossus stenolepis TaxID=195615 RepID=UPI00159C0238|nr:golgin subfamily A member 6-like protein 22 [Hippoglossus stenolepis]
MASCLVPDFPAVMVALEHLKELDNVLKEEGVPFAPEASLHLAELKAAVTDLESDRRAAHEHLEVETIENSKLRLQINNIRDRMSQEIKADVAAARASNAEEMELLHKELNTVSGLREATENRQGVLLSQNEALHPHRELEKAQHEEVVAVLNDQISLKYSLQMQLDQTLGQIEELKVRIAAVKQDKMSLEQNMVLEREAFTVRKRSLSGDENQMDEKIKQQKQVIRRSRREQGRVNGKKQESRGRLEELVTDSAKIEGNLQRLTESRCQFEKQLDGETQRRQDLRQQRETLKKELCDSGEVFRLAIQNLKERITAVESKIEEGQASKFLCQDHLAHIHEIFKQQHDEESNVRAEHSRASQQLERSGLQLEERVASVVKHNKEIREMDKQIRELLQADTINKRMFERNQEELCGNVDTEKKTIRHHEEERNRLRRLLEEAKREQEEHMAKITSGITSTRRRYEELRQEEAALQQRQPKSTDADLLMNHVTECAAEYRQIEIQLHQEIEQCTAETEGITRSNEEKQRVVEEKEEMLKEVEARWNEEQSRHQRLKTLISELRRRRAELELSVQVLKEKTSSLLQPKEEMKAELEETRARHMDVLARQASELRAVELSIYDTSVKLEQVSVENSRLHLCIRQMTEDVNRVRWNKDRYWQEVHKFNRDTQALFETLQEAWREDILVTEDCQRSDGVLLVCMNTLLNHLKTRRQQLGHVNTLLHQKMLEFSKRLGDKT